MDEKEYIDITYGDIVGRTIVKIRPLIKQEIEELLWDGRFGAVPFCIILDDGQVLIPSQDAELNGPGYLLLGDLED